MTESAASFVLSPAGIALLAEITAHPEDPLRLTLRLRDKNGLSLEQVSALVSVATARQRAKKRFPDAEHLFLTEDALAQATSPILAAYHARFLAPLGVVADLGCGIGMDTLALAETGASVLAIEQDPARLLFARANAAVRGVTDRITFLQGDVTTQDWQADALFWDPARRDGDTRVSRHADRYEPPLSFLTSARTRVRGGAVKLSPALPDDTLRDLNARIEFLSERGECKEACAWFGEAQGLSGSRGWSAVLLPEGLVLATEEVPAPVHPVGQFIFDPDPALIRAHALGTLAAQEQIGLVSPEDAYLTGGHLLSHSRWASAYEVQTVMPYRPRHLARWLREQEIGRLVVKKRHFPREPDAVHRELGLKGKGKEATLILVHEGSGFLAVVCVRVQYSHETPAI
ncbi:MAG: methyltransferase domain-containing protein [Armatimonadaceae bacterium]